MTTQTYVVSGMTCAHCVGSVNSEVGNIAGVQTVEVDLATGQVTVTGQGFTDEQVREAVDEAGYALAEA